MISLNVWHALLGHAHHLSRNPVDITGDGAVVLQSHIQSFWGRRCCSGSGVQSFLGILLNKITTSDVYKNCWLGLCDSNFKRLNILFSALKAPSLQMVGIHKSKINKLKLKNCRYKSFRDSYQKMIVINTILLFLKLFYFNCFVIYVYLCSICILGPKVPKLGLRSSSNRRYR